MRKKRKLSNARKSEKVLSVSPIDKISDDTENKHPFRPTPQTSASAMSEKGETEKAVSTSIEGEDNDRFVCVNCLTPSATLYKKYSKEVIRITNCKNCGEAVDKYIEQDNVLIFVDLILLYSSAYRHLLLNTEFTSYSRLIFVFLLSDAYNQWIQRRSPAFDADGKKESEQTPSSPSYDLVWAFYGCLLESALKMLAFALTEFTAQRSYFWFLKWKSPRKEDKNGEFFGGRKNKAPFGRSETRFFFEATFLGFFGNVFVVAVVIWRLHQTHWTHRVLPRLFIALSHFQVQRALCPHVPPTLSAIFVALGLLAQSFVGNTVRLLLPQPLEMVVDQGQGGFTNCTTQSASFSFLADMISML